MSNRASAIVWDNYPVGGTEKLVVLALADWCNDDGASLYPSISRIAERVCVHQRNVQRVMSRLIEQGVLEVIGNEFGGRPGIARQYRLRLDRIVRMRPIATETGDAGATRGNPTGGTGATRGAGVTGGAGVARRVALASQTGGASATLTTIEPSLEPSLERERERATPAAPAPAPDADPSPDAKPNKPRPSKQCPGEFEVTDDLADWARRECPRVDLARETAKFRDHTFKGARSDWPGTWRNWIRRADETVLAAQPRPGRYVGRYGATIAALTGRDGNDDDDDSLDLRQGAIDV